MWRRRSCREQEKALFRPINSLRPRVSKTISNSLVKSKIEYAFLFSRIRTGRVFGNPCKCLEAVVVETYESRNRTKSITMMMTSGRNGKDLSSWRVRTAILIASALKLLCVNICSSSEPPVLGCFPSVAGGIQCFTTVALQTSSQPQAVQATRSPMGQCAREIWR